MNRYFAPSPIRIQKPKPIAASLLPATIVSAAVLLPKFVPFGAFLVFQPLQASAVKSERIPSEIYFAQNDCL